MQARVWERVKELTTAEHRALRGLPPSPGPPVGERLGFHWPDDVVFRAWRGLKLFNILPHAGGWLDQDAWLSDDIDLMDALYTEAWIETRPPDGQRMTDG